MAVLHSLVITLCAVGVFYFIQQWQHAFMSSLLGIILASTVIMAYFIKIQRENMLGKVITATHDNLSIMQADDCPYVSDSNKQMACPNCQSYRVVSLFNYKWVRKRTEKAVYKRLEHLTEKRHVGCLSCLKVYSLTNNLDIELSKPTKSRSKKEFIVFFLVAALSLFIIIFRNDIFISDDIKDLTFFFSIMWMNSLSLFLPKAKIQVETKKLTEL